MSINGKIISPNEHESHHAYDLIYNALMLADWYCGDTHSINQESYSLLRLLGKKFTPHIKKIVDKSKKIGSFNDPDTYSNCLIKPEKKFKLDLIKEEWDNLQHIYASLLMRTTSHSVVVRKLSSHKRSNKTQSALWEYEKILMSMNILKFIDDPAYQQAIRGALNRIEGYHQLIAKIGGVNGGKFRGTTEAELAIWNECCRFVANCIIYYSGIILSKIYQEQEKLGKNAQRLQELEDMIAAKEASMKKLKETLSKALNSFEGKGLTVEQKNGKVYVSMENKLLFNSGSWLVSSEGKKAVVELGKVLGDNPDIAVLIEGHTDDDAFSASGPITDNWDLSTKRATSIVGILSENKKINKQNLTAAGRGEFSPLASNETADGKAKNRRIEIILTPRLDAIAEMLNEIN